MKFFSYYFMFVLLQRHFELKWGGSSPIVSAGVEIAGKDDCYLSFHSCITQSASRESAH